MAVMFDDKNIDKDVKIRYLNVGYIGGFVLWWLCALLPLALPEGSISVEAAWILFAVWIAYAVLITGSIFWTGYAKAIRQSMQKEPGARKDNVSQLLWTSLSWFGIFTAINLAQDTPLLRSLSGAAVFSLAMTALYYLVFLRRPKSEQTKDA